MESSEVSRSKEAIRHGQIETVKGLSPEFFLTPEKRGQIVDTLINGLDLIAGDVGDAQAIGLDPRKVALNALWPLRDFVRSALTHPLPAQVFEYDEGQVPVEAGVADEVDWLEILSPEQKGVIFSEVVGLDVAIEPPESDEPVILQEGEVMTHKDGTSFIPLLVWNHGTAALSAIPHTTAIEKY